jgi:RNA polymerase sigma-70 factor (ECF subfamily)
MTDKEFREAYQRHKDVLYRFARRMTGSSTEAEDIVQDSFLELWRNASRFDPSRGSLRSFLIGITRNLIRRRVRSDRLYDELEEDTTQCGPIDLAGLERADVIARAVAALPPQQRETLILAEYEGMSLEEIGSATQANLAAVKSRLHRARENLRRMLPSLLETKGAVHGTNERSSTE